MADHADLVVVNSQVITLDRHRPTGQAVAVLGGRVLAVGTTAHIRVLVGPSTRVVDAERGLVIPAFHDAHMHLLSYARAYSRLDCHAIRGLGELRAALSGRARSQPAGTWIRALAYDEAVFADGRHPDRFDLDASAPHHPVRLQHRSMHLDILNTLALRVVGLWDARPPQLERDPRTDEPTGRLYHAANLLRGRLPRPADEELAHDVRRASERLLSWGVTSIQDASVTNGIEEWDLFHRLSARGDLRLRVFFMSGAPHWRQVAAAQPPGPSVRLGPVKFVIDESTTEPGELRLGVAEARAAGRAVALHATSEAELALALDAVRTAGPGRASAPDRIEHGSVIPDACLADLRAMALTIVAQPALVYERGDMYREEYPPELHGWLHRARSLLEAGIPYAAGSDAPVTEPAPRLGLFAAQRRLTRGGTVLGLTEVLGRQEALRAFTLAPATAVGADLGRLQPGARADLVILDADALEPTSAEAARRPVRLTVKDGHIVWRRAGW